jgi:DNA-binding LytR/AlgR family response regulator
MEQKVRILLVEDEFVTLNALSSALTRMGYEISGDAMKAEEALMVLERGTTDLAILDIHLKKGPSGIWLAQQIQERFKIPFIFLSAFGDKKTIAEAAATKPASYLVKPFSPQDLQAAIELAMYSYAGEDKDGGHDETSAGLLINDSIFVKDQLVYRRIPLSDIAFVQAFRNYLEITSGDNKYVLRSPLKDFVDQLPAEHFFQTHRSYIVNLALIDQIGGNFVGIGKHEVPLSRNVRQEVMTRLNMYG